MFAAFKPSMVGQPWDELQDANLLSDYVYGCSAFTMAMRARRTEAEVVARLEELGRPMSEQPPKRKIRRTDWTRKRKGE
jgi:hypothetical protein